MKKILTIVATALLSTIAGAAHAQTTATVNFLGNVASFCNITSSTNGALTSATPATALNTTVPAKVLVICNGGTNTLFLGNTSTNLPAQPDTPVTTASFSSGGTGVFSTATSGVIASLENPTTSAGDTANISATVTAAPGKLLKAGSYSVNVIATITP